MDQTTATTSDVLILTGMSGAGRSTAANALEDLGWYVVDNLPPQMLKPMLELSEIAASALPKVAAVVDVRGRDLFTALPAEVGELRSRRNVRIVFLDASDDVLVRRFEAVRRPHPLQGDGTLIDGIRTERERLSEIRERADVVVDTSSLNVHQLATRIFELFSDEGAARHMLTIMSFGFKYGLPTDADMVADMRFLPNPYWDPSLRAFTGQDRRCVSTCSPSPGPGNSWMPTPQPCSRCCRAISARTSGTRSSLSDAQEANTARSSWSKNSPGDWPTRQGSPCV